MESQNLSPPPPSSSSSWVRGKCIGRGSFGTVHLAVNQSNGEAFAVKSVDQKTSQLESLKNEIRFLRSLSSPHIVKYLGEDLTTSHLNLHMEYLSGGTVADLGDDVDERIVRSYTWCILSALKYVHSKNIVHCDLKGKNVLVGPTSGVAKLADFGSAKSISGDTKVLPRGSPLWMAPEVIRGEYQGPESDVWSLGCTLIEMVTGEPAWEDEGVDTLFRIGFSDQLPVFPVQLSELGQDFLGKCLIREKSERWSCDQLLQHPFVSSVSVNKFSDSSPRCVLDWCNSEFCDEDEDEDDDDKIKSSLNFDSDQGASGRRRILELACSRGANWESDGWVDIRGASEEEEGTSWEYTDLFTAVEEISGIGSAYSDSMRIREENERAGLEYLNCDNYILVDGGRWEAGSSWQNGWQKAELEVEEEGFYIYNYSWCKLLLLYFHVIIFRCSLLLYYFISSTI